jgi:hypothetical protein
MHAFMLFPVHSSAPHERFENHYANHNEQANQDSAAESNLNIIH